MLLKLLMLLLRLLAVGEELIELTLALTHCHLIILRTDPELLLPMWLW